MKKVCVVAIAKDEESFLNEWLVYHKLIGLDYFYIYDNDSKLPLAELLAPHQEYCKAISWPPTLNNNDGQQIAAYNHALNNYIKDYEWVIFLDIDEFIFLGDIEYIAKFLDIFDAYTAVSLPWHVFGHNGLYTTPRRLITSTFNRRQKNVSEEVKTFSRTAFISEIKFPHYCEMYNNYKINCNQFFADQGQNHRVMINHYQCRSFEQWMHRFKRGDVNFKQSNVPQHHLWRLTREGCLREFVTNIAYDKNEFVDLNINTYKYNILKGIANIRKDNPLVPATHHELLTQIDTCLAEIANLLLKNYHHLEDLNLTTGKIGIAFFLFLYGDYIKNRVFTDVAKDIIEEIADNLDETTSTTFSNGIAGFGVIIEFLVAKGFMEIDTNEILSDIDELIHYHLITKPYLSLSTNIGLTGPGRYYCARLNSPVNDYHHPRERENLRLLEEIVDLLDAAYNNYEELISVIDFLSRAYALSVKKKKIFRFINYALDKIETMTYEDNFFQVSNAQKDTLTYAYTFLKSYEFTGHRRLRKMALIYYKHYLQLNEVNSHSLQMTNTTMLIYLETKINRKEYSPYCIDILEQLLKVENNFAPDSRLHVQHLLNQGIVLLSGVRCNGLDWMEILSPVST